MDTAKLNTSEISPSVVYLHQIVVLLSPIPIEVNQAGEDYLKGQRDALLDYFTIKGIPAMVSEITPEEFQTMVKSRNLYNPLTGESRDAPDHGINNH